MAAEEGEWRLTIVLRRDLDLGRGKLAAQAAHAAVARALEADPVARDAWLEAGQPKIVLGVAGEDVLLDLCRRAERAGIGATLVRDAGRTQVPAGTATACALGPAPRSALDPLTGDLRLL